MKSITICQPYATLISMSPSDARHKRIENRGANWRYRGQIAIHAGKSRTYLHEDMCLPWPEGYGLTEDDLTFGAVIALAYLVDCLTLDQVYALPKDHDLAWVKSHSHTEGPWCLVLKDVVRIEPVPCRGALGLFDLPANVAAAVMAQVGGKAGGR